MHRIVPAFLLCLGLLHAGVTKVDVTERHDSAFPGYEVVTGKIHFSVDPALPANRIIVDLARAPKGADGKVEFTADLYLIHPKDPAKGNGTALFEVSNRGGRGLVQMFDRGTGDPGRDSLLLSQGFTLVWVGWQWDVPQGRDALRLYAPSAPGITGKVLAQIITNSRTTSEILSDRQHEVYPALPGEPVSMTVRDDYDGLRTVIPASQWKISADGKHVEFPAGFEPGRIYEVIYTAKDPVIAGLGPAAIRDYMSYMKQQGEAKRILAFGNSQSGRFLRSFLYDGFNTDEKGQRVFDGVWAHVAGAGEGEFNIRFAQPSRSDGAYPLVMFPFTSEPQRDGSVTDGLLARAKKDGTAPKIFFTNSAVEYWGRAAALTHLQIDGKKDALLSPDERIFFLSGAPHSPRGNPVRNNTQNLGNPLDYRLAMRALLQRFNAWLTDGTAPPASNIPRAAKDELVAANALAFPKIPGVKVPEDATVPYRFDFGPRFRSQGIIDAFPPHAGKAFPLLLPRVDADGNEIGGLRLPDHGVPLGTYTGWNLRAPEIGGSQRRLPLTGSFIPFARTKAERTANGDPRLSIEERYPNKQDYLGRIKVSAQKLTADGYLLAQDVDLAVALADERWTMLMGAAAAAR